MKAISATITEIICTFCHGVYEENIIKKKHLKNLKCPDCGQKGCCFETTRREIRRK